jgi:hypothetical protein
MDNYGAARFSNKKSTISYSRAFLASCSMEGYVTASDLPLNPTLVHVCWLGTKMIPKIVDDWIVRG